MLHQLSDGHMFRFIICVERWAILLLSRFFRVFLACCQILSYHNYPWAILSTLICPNTHNIPVQNRRPSSRFSQAYTYSRSISFFGLLTRSKSAYIGHRHFSILPDKKPLFHDRKIQKLTTKNDFFQFFCVWILPTKLMHVLPIFRCRFSFIFNFINK